jgi:uncharacterized membrane protein YfcA
MDHLEIFILIALVVGFVTAGLKIQFDRFFAVLLLISILKVNAFQAVNIFLWIIMLSALYLIGKNWQKLNKMPIENKKKFLTLVPILSLIGVLIGSWLFGIATNKVLVEVIGVLALLYGLRLVFFHFAEHEFNYLGGTLLIQKSCGFIGPVMSGFFNGFVGTTLKPLKVPFAVKLGKMNMEQVYLGNTITAFYASFFSIIVHSFMSPKIAMSLTDLYWGVALWLAIHTIYELSYSLFKHHWRKGFQIFIGLILIIVSFKLIL